ncbi:MAG TPA: thioredoxin-disulfide reductase [Candidatus Methanoperedens sp.]|nr:thioredoxin-disulfide reductase [Candidatus Methanoperedens sp.]
MSTDYEIVIIGGGPAGLTAGIYAARARRRTVLLEKHGTGGQMALTWEVENYPGVEKIGGYELGQIMERQARSFGLEIRSLDVTGVATAGGRHRLATGEGELTCRALVLATGARSNRLGVPGEAELTGRGVSYCATCDGAFYQGVPVAVIGGGDTALEEALFLTRFASRVFLVHRRAEFRGTRLLQERIAAEPKIEPVLEAVVEGIEGTQGVTGLALKNVKTGAASRLAVEGAFIFVGTSPNTEFLKGFVPLDEHGFIPTTPHLETPVPGVFAAGDCRAKLLRQISVAVGEGALAATMADHYLSR